MLNHLILVGNILFRYRSYIPLLFVGLVFVAMAQHPFPVDPDLFTNLWAVFCIAVSFLGFFIRVITTGCTPRHTSGRNTKRQKAEQLNTTGIYSLVRNPLYLGNFFTGLGVALFPMVWHIALIYTLLFCLFYERIILAEEDFLTSKFGEPYQEWVSRTPAFFPKFSGYVPPAYPFSFKSVLRREYNSFYAIVAVMTVLKIVSDYSGAGQLNFNTAWTAFFAVGTFIWLGLRSVKKYSSFLFVPGR